MTCSAECSCADAVGTCLSHSTILCESVVISAVALTPLASSQSGQQRIAGIGLITTDSSNLSGGLFADVIALVNDRRLGIGVKHHLMRYWEQQPSRSSPTSPSPLPIHC